MVSWPSPWDSTDGDTGRPAAPGGYYAAGVTMRTMAGLDPETVRWLSQLGVAATIIASVIALVSNLIGQLIQRRTQLELDRRKATREYREQLVREFRVRISHRTASVDDLYGAVSRGNTTEIKTVIKQLQSEHTFWDPSYLHGGAADAQLLKALREFADMETELGAFARRHGDSVNLVNLGPTITVLRGKLLKASLTLNQAIERYVLGGR